MTLMKSRGAGELGNRSLWYKDLVNLIKSGDRDSLDEAIRILELHNSKEGLSVGEERTLRRARELRIVS
jgi:hypothetical protein